MPLNIEREVEHPDVTALKAKVTTVARRYASSHGWCSVVEDALREAGVTGTSGPRNINVEVTFTVNGGEEQKAVHRFPRDPLAVAESVEAQHQYVLDQIVVPSVVLGVEVKPEVQIIDLTEATHGKGGLEYPDGFVHVYSSREGRVAHLLREPTDRGHTENLRRWLRRGLHYAMCGSMMSAPTEESDRSEDRVCKKCLERAQSAVA